MEASAPQTPDSRSPRDNRIAAWIFGTLLLLFLLGVFIWGPTDLPVFRQRLLAFFSALLAGFVGYFLTGTLAVNVETTGTRFGKVGVKAAAGFAAFVLMLLWWLSPWTPVEAEPSTHRVRVSVVDPEGRTVEEAEVTSSVGGEVLQAAGGWEIVLPAQSVGESRSLTVRAAKPEDFLLGEATVGLVPGEVSEAVVVLRPEPVAPIRGRVVDVDGRALAGVLVSADGRSATTSETGEFELVTTAADGQSVRLRAEKGGLRPVDQWHPAGTPVTLQMSREDA